MVCVLRIDRGLSTFAINACNKDSMHGDVIKKESICLPEEMLKQCQEFARQVDEVRYLGMKAMINTDANKKCYDDFIETQTTIIVQDPNAIHEITPRSSFS